jgi:thiol-disulfide isomerase/thioredoxin
MPSARARLFLIVTLIGILASIGAGPPVPPRGGQGQVHAAERRLLRAPAFSLPDLDGRTRALAEFLGTKPILLEFMSLDCPHCREMASVLTRLHTAYGKRVQFLTVTFDKNPRRVRAFAEKEKHGWPYLIGNQETIDAYKLEGVPTFVLVTPDGRVAGFLVGSASHEAMSQGIEAVLAGP